MVDMTRIVHEAPTNINTATSRAVWENEPEGGVDDELSSPAWKRRDTVDEIIY